MLSYQIMGLPQVEALSEQELHRRLDKLETRIKRALDDRTTPLEEEWEGDALVELGMISAAAEEHLRRRLLPGYDLYAEDILLAVLAHPDLTAEQLQRAAGNAKTVATTKAAIEHPSCDLHTISTLSNRYSRDLNHHHHRSGTRKVLWEHSPHGAAAVVLATIPRRNPILGDNHTTRIKKLGDGGYPAVETYHTLVQDHIAEGKTVHVEESNPLIEQALLLNQ